MDKYIQFITENPKLVILASSVIIILATLAALFITKKILNVMEKFAREKTRIQSDEKLLAYLKKPIGRLILLIGAYYFFDNFTRYFGASYEKYIDGIFYVLIVFQITFTLMKLFEKGLNIFALTKMDTKLAGEREKFFPLVARVMKLIIFFIALIFIFKHFHQDVQSLVVSLGVGSLAIALAAQETLSNMIAGFVIMTDLPFRVGDRISLSSGEIGDVYEIGLRSTKVRTFDNTLLIVPNAEIIKEKVVNLSYPNPLLRVKVLVGVAYGSDLELVKKILEDVCKENPKVMDNPPPVSYFLEFGESSLDLRVTCFVNDWNEEWNTAEEIRLEIYKRFIENAIEIPFPQRTLWWGSGQDIQKNIKKDMGSNKSDNHENDQLQT